MTQWIKHLPHKCTAVREELPNGLTLPVVKCQIEETIGAKVPKKSNTIVVGRVQSKR